MIKKDNLTNFLVNTYFSWKTCMIAENYIVFKDFKTNIYIYWTFHSKTNKLFFEIHYIALNLLWDKLSYWQYCIVEIMFLLQKRKRSLCISRVQECVSFCIQYNKHRSMLLMLTTTFNFSILLLETLRLTFINGEI